MFVMSFATGNAAFNDEPGALDLETARILREVASRVERGEASGKFQNCSDINGNIVGTWKLNPREEG